MRYAKLTPEQSKEINSKEKGYTSGKRNQETGLREEITFCSMLAFRKAFGYEIEVETIEI